MSSETSVVTEVLAPGYAEALERLLDLDVGPGAEGPGELPELWHWIYLLPRPRTRDLGPDGHPTHGIPAPPGPGRRRMFAGGRVVTRHRLRLGREATRTTSLASTVEKEGRTGPLTFATVRHEIAQDGRVAIVEEQDIVYRAPGGGALPDRDARPGLPERPARLDVEVDEAFLFRFSALTYNAHRIHYDHAWVREEGYDDLVVHGPLQALLMGELSRRHGGLVGREFAYRLVAPMTGPQRVTVLAAPEGAHAGAEVADTGGRVTARATITTV